MNRTRVLIGLGLAALPLCADTLVLRGGRRVEGELVGYRAGRIEFEDRRGRIERFERDDVISIEFDSRGRGRDDRDGPRDRDRPVRPGWSGEDRGGTGRPSGLRERSVAVAAAEAWTDTGIDVRRGQSLYFDADGRISWGRDRRDGPAGEGGSHFNANRPIPSRAGGALIGRIGRDAFFVGDEKGPLQVREGGRLYLGINDDYLLDNSGSFRVTVYY